MPDQLLPPIGLDHPLPDDLTPSQYVAIWLDLLASSEQMLLAGLRARLPPGGDLRAAYQAWVDEYNRDHFAMLERMAERFNRISSERLIASDS